MSIYFDNAATTYPKPPQVYEAAENFMRNIGTSPGRGGYKKAMAAEEIVYNTRKSLAKLFKGKKASEIIFTSNATEALNLAVKGFLKKGDEVLTTNVEHNALYRPLIRAREEIDVVLHQFCCDKEGKVDFEEIKSKLTDKIKLVAITHGSNVLGNILPIEKIAAMAKEKNITVLIDASQSAGVLDINCENIDMLGFTGHKGLMGITGTGGLCLKTGLELGTLKEGGTGSMAVSPYPPKEPPDRYEAGTLNVTAIASLGAALQFLKETGIENIHKHEENLTAQLIYGLKKIPNIEIYGSSNANERLGLVSFNIGSLDSHKTACILDENYDIMVRAGLHCAPCAHDLLGTKTRGALRASFGYYNTEDEVQALINAVKEIAHKEV